ncbi:MAG: ParA family protein, partial [Candidatus Syntrophosphaera sp.]
IIGNSPLNDAVVPTATDNLWCVPSNINLTGAEIELVHEFAREHKLREALEPVQNQYDYIIIDCPPSLGLLTVNALTAATDLLVPIQCEYYALEGVSQLLSTIRLIQKNLNPQLNIIGILLTMFDRRVNLSMQVAREVRHYFKEKVFRTIIPRNIKLTEAPSFGKPIFLYDIRSPGAMSYLNLATEIIERT